MFCPPHLPHFNICSKIGAIISIYSRGGAYTALSDFRTLTLEAGGQNGELFNKLNDLNMLKSTLIYCNFINNVIKHES